LICTTSLRESSGRTLMLMVSGMAKSANAARSFPKPRVLSGAACTAHGEVPSLASNVSGSIPVGQRLARHASAQTTATFYRKGMPDRMFIDGMKGLNRKHD